MWSSYPIALNVEVTNLCNAKCAMCPRDAIEHSGYMSASVFSRLLDRIEEARRPISFVSLCGFGEAVISPNFLELIEQLRQRKPRLRTHLTMVTNGRGLTAERIGALDGVLDELKVSFSSFDPEVYGYLHRGLDLEQTSANIELAARMLRQTSLTMHLSPSPLILPGLEQTVRHWRARGVSKFVLLPIAFNRGGKLDRENLHGRWNWLWLRRWRLGITGLDRVMIKSPWHALAIKWHNRGFRCFARACTLAVNWQGLYLYCFNDIAASHPIGDIRHDSIDAVVAARQEMPPSRTLCQSCNYAPRRVQEGQCEFVGPACGLPQAAPALLSTPASA